MRNLKFALVAAIAMATSGCTTMSLEKLRRTTPTGTEFQKALAQKYLDFANNEATKYDWIDSMIFADKGLMSAYGKDTAPEDPTGWRIPKRVRPLMEEARAALVAALTSENKAGKPDAAARAQFHFDCWVEEQEEDWQDDDIARCRDGFAEAMQELTGVAVAKDTAPKPAPIPASQPASEPVADVVLPLSNGDRPAEVVTYIVFFEEGTSVLSASGKKVIEEALRALKPGDEVVLNSHSDTHGDARYNLELSQRRAETVRQKLIGGGVPEEAIKIFAYGESDPPVKTGDGVKEPANRRVEIFLN
jgi:OmpA-OmpF porin, OOP family